MWGSRYSSSELASWCQAIHHGHGAGVSLTKVFRQLAKSGPSALRASSEQMVKALERGDSLADSLTRFLPEAPPVFLGMGQLAEETGQIPEVFGHLEKYFREQHQLERQFRTQAARPLIQLVLAIVILGATFVVLGALGASTVGASSLLVGGILLAIFIVAGFVIYRQLKSSVSRQASDFAFLSKIPSIGGCLHALAMSRFCLAMRLTLDSSIPVNRALRLGLQSMGAVVDESQSKRMDKMLSAGHDLSKVLGTQKLFQNDFLATVSVGEVSGQLPEVMARQAEHYREETSRRFRRLTTQLNMALSVAVGLAMVIAILILAQDYLKALNG